jgi:hypothetical protein
MTITLDLPDDIAQRLGQGRSLSRAALEAIAIEGYRSGTLTPYETRRLLGFETRYELDGFLKQHRVWENAYDFEDLERDRKTAENADGGPASS